VERKIFIQYGFKQLFHLPILFFGVYAIAMGQYALVALSCLAVQFFEVDIGKYFIVKQG
jgi:hypothetical protein